MKKIEAIVRVERRKAVEDALLKAGICALTVYDVHGRGEQRGITTVFRGRERRVDLLPKVKLDIIVEDGDLDKAIAAIIKGARTGEIGDGRIFVSTIDDAIRVRTGKSTKLNGASPKS